MSGKAKNVEILKKIENVINDGWTVCIWNDKRVSNFGKISLLGYTLIILGLMVFEIFQITLLSLFHIIYILKLFILKLKKEDNTGKIIL